MTEQEELRPVITAEEMPKEVVDPVSWKKYVLMRNSVILRRVKVVASDGSDINLLHFPDRFKQTIKHLNVAEQEELQALYTKRRQVQAACNRFKAFALGSFEAARARKAKEKAELRAQDELIGIPLAEDIKELLGKMFTPKEVVRIMAESRQIEISLDDVKDVLKKNIAEIEKRRDEFRNRINDVRLYSKRPRLEELSWMYSQMKMRYKALNSIDAYNALLRTLEQIRKESEGDQVTINGAIDINVEAEIKLHIEQTIYRAINLKEIILGRVAARMNWSLPKLVAGLHNSYYARFMPDNEEYDPEAEMTYPSSMNYDFAAIQHAHAASGIDEVQDVKAEPVTADEKAEGKAIRELFLSRIKARRDAYTAPAQRANADDEAYRTKLKGDVGDEQPLTKAQGRVYNHIKPSKK